jgi:hypothetical protein
MLRDCAAAGAACAATTASAQASLSSTDGRSLSARNILICLHPRFEISTLKFQILT